jgi:uncharacterized protein with HEPN domain
LYDIRDAIANIDGFIGSGPKLFADFKANMMLRLAVERSLEIIGEATSRILKIDPAFPIANARKSVDLRNYVIHGYDLLDVEMVWNIVINHRPLLRVEVERLLST